MNTAIVAYKSDTKHGWISSHSDEFFIGQDPTHRVQFVSVEAAERAIHAMRYRGFNGKFTITNPQNEV